MDFYHFQSFDMFSTVSMASQSEIARRLEESSPENHQLDTGSPRFLSRSQISHGEHPLSLGKTSIWNQFFQVGLYSIFINGCYVTFLMPPFTMHILYLNMEIISLKLSNRTSWVGHVNPSFNSLLLWHVFTCRRQRSWNRLTGMLCGLIQTYTSSQGTQLSLNPTK